MLYGVLMFPMPATCPAHPPPPFAKVHVCVTGSTRSVEAAVT
jgi:hypothetical protein